MKRSQWRFFLPEDTDIDQDGTLSDLEVQHKFNTYMGELFKLLDDDKDNYITEEEFRSLNLDIAQLTKAVDIVLENFPLRPFFLAADGNGDGFYDQNDFYKSNPFQSMQGILSKVDTCELVSLNCITSCRTCEPPVLPPSPPQNGLVHINCNNSDNFYDRNTFFPQCERNIVFLDCYSSSIPRFIAHSLTKQHDDRDTKHKEDHIKHHLSSWNRPGGIIVQEASIGGLLSFFLNRGTFVFKGRPVKYI